METKILLKNSIVTKLSVLILEAVLIPMSAISAVTYKRQVEKQKNDYIQNDLKSLKQRAAS